MSGWGSGSCGEATYEHQKRIDFRDGYGRCSIGRPGLQLRGADSNGHPNADANPDGPRQHRGPLASAQELSQACEKATASSHFDLVRNVTNKPSDGEAFDRSESILRAAGADYHWTMQSYDGVKHEDIYVGGVSYRRGGSGPWVEGKDPRYEGLGNSFGVDFTAQGWSLCPHLEVSEDKGWVKKVGEENLDGVTTTVYTTGNDVVAPTIMDANFTINVTLHFWVDGTGQLVQYREIQTHPPSPADSWPGVVATTVTKVSGVGEPNTITAPVLGE